MRILIGAAMSALVFAASASAQTTPPPAAAAPAQSECAAIEPAPQWPNGEQASRREMEQGNEAYSAWYHRNEGIVTCRRNEYLALQARVDALLAEHNAAVEALNAANTAWQAEAAEYNARTGPTRRP